MNEPEYYSHRSECYYTYYYLVGVADLIYISSAGERFSEKNWLILAE